MTIRQTNLTRELTALYDVISWQRLSFIVQGGKLLRRVQ